MRVDYSSCMWKHVEPWLPVLVPILIAYVFWPFVSAIITLAFRKRTPEEWEAWALKKPGLALLVEMCKANGFDIGKNLKLVQRYAQRQSGRLPEDLWDKLPVSPNLRLALRNPEMRRLLESMVAGGARGEPAPLATPDVILVVQPPAPPATTP